MSGPTISFDLLNYSLVCPIAHCHKQGADNVLPTLQTFWIANSKNLTNYEDI